MSEVIESARKIAKILLENLNPPQAELIAALLHEALPEDDKKIRPTFTLVHQLLDLAEKNYQHLIRKTTDTTISDNTNKED